MREAAGRGWAEDGVVVVVGVEGEGEGGSGGCGLAGCRSYSEQDFWATLPRCLPRILLLTAFCYKVPGAGGKGLGKVWVGKG